MCMLYAFKRIYKEVLTVAQISKKKKKKVKDGIK